MIKQCFSFALVVFLLAPAHVLAAAQTNPVPALKFPWVSSAAVGLTLTRGNSDTVLTTIKAQTEKKNPLNEFLFEVDGAYGENNSIRNTETLHATGQYNHLFSERLFGYVNAEGLHDGVADLQYRINFGPGAGYYLVKETNTSLAVEIGPGLIIQRLGDVNTTYATFRLGERFERKFDHNARIWQNVEFMPEVDEPENFLINSEIGAEATLTKKLGIQICLQDNFVNHPAPGRKDNDIKLVSGLVYKF